MMDGIGMGGNRPKEVSLGSDALDDIKALRADEIQERNAQNHFRTYDPILEKLVLELVGEIKQIRHQLEIITGEEIGDIER